MNPEIEKLEQKFNCPKQIGKPNATNLCFNGSASSSPVFFMIGCQRSGSNWIRTMLGEREDLIAPHPPHIMREFMPILSKFGDLDNNDNLKVLVDHVCTFVEHNQVTWYDKHDRPIKFDRQGITIGADITVKVLRAVQEQKSTARTNLKSNNSDKNDVGSDVTPKNHDNNGKQQIIDNKYYLLAIFDEIMNYCAEVNDKHTWMCKSMGMSKYHDMLIAMYGPERLRYIYLVRDPRDVTLSFMKTPVGDCHPYSIAKKWAKLQDHALYIKAKAPELLHEVRYEDVINDKVGEIAKINKFIGQRRTGKLMRRGSVVIIKDENDMTNASQHGHEATKAAVLSYQFKNLTRGDSFLKKQFQKWRVEMNEKDMHIVETVTKEQMSHLNYNYHAIDKNSNYSFSEAEQKSFEEENKKLIDEMNQTLIIENPDDYKRRINQSKILQYSEPDYLRESFRVKICDLDLIDENDQQNDLICYEDDALLTFTSLDDIKDTHDVFRLWPENAHQFGYLSEEEIELNTTESKQVRLNNGRIITFAAASQTGYYPRQRAKENQDSYIAGISSYSQNDDSAEVNSDYSEKDTEQQRMSSVLFSVFDGHGNTGNSCSQMVRDVIRQRFAEGGINKEICSNAPAKQESKIESMFHDLYEEANDQLIQNEDINSSQSGTTAISLLVDNEFFHVANVGDSRCIIASTYASPDDPSQEEFKVHTLSYDHTPTRTDEMTRLKSNGALVLTSEEYDALESSQHSSFSKENNAFLKDQKKNQLSGFNDSSPLRVWSTDGGKYPGCAFTRSIGDEIAKELGVTAEPEYQKCTLTDDHSMFILGSDGIFDFISNEEAVGIASQCSNVSEACRTLVGTAYSRWIKNEERTDDITVIVGFLSQ